MARKWIRTQNTSSQLAGCEFEVLLGFRDQILLVLGFRIEGSGISVFCFLGLGLRV